MANLINLTPNKTYATRENAIKAVEKKFPSSVREYSELTYFLQEVRKGGDGTDAEDRRFFPVFIGERALRAMVHFHFHVVA